MKIVPALLVSILLLGCLQTENSNSLDEQFGGGLTGSAEFQAARAVLTASCSSCHVYHTKTESELVTLGVVVAGDSLNSKLYYRLQGSSGAMGPKNMPTSGTLSASDRNAIATWIDNM